MEPVEPVEWPEKEECLEVSSDGNGYWSDSMTESSVTESVDGWLEGEERDNPMGGWRTLSPESDKSHDSNASTREPSPRRSTVLESFCRVFPPVRMDIQVDSEESEEEKPLLREKKMTEDQGSGSTHGEEEESEVLHNRVYRPEVDCHKRSKSWDRGMVRMPETMKNSCLPQAEEGEPERCMERCMERWREGSEDPEVWSMEDRRLVESYRITIRENGMVVLSQRELMKERERKLERRKNSLSRKELFAELDKVTEEQKQKQKQKQKHKSVNEEKKEQNWVVENTSLDDDDRCLEIAIEEAAEMKEKKK